MTPRVTSNSVMQRKTIQKFRLFLILIITSPIITVQSRTLLSSSESGTQLCLALMVPGIRQAAGNDAPMQKPRFWTQDRNRNKTWNHQITFRDFRHFRPGRCRPGGRPLCDGVQLIKATGQILLTWTYFSFSVSVRATGTSWTSNNTFIWKDKRQW